MEHQCLNALVKMSVLSKMYTLMPLSLPSCMSAFKYTTVLDLLYTSIDKTLHANNAGKMAWCIYGFFSLIFWIDANAFSYRALASIEFAAVVLLWCWFLSNLPHYALIGMSACAPHRCNNHTKNRPYVIFIFYIYSSPLEFIHLSICLYQYLWSEDSS